MSSNVNLQKEFKAWNKVRAARDPKRPKAKQYIDALFTDFIELHGDRMSHDDPTILAGIGYLDEQAVTVIAIQKGDTMEENITYHFGMPLPSGYRKALRHMQLASRFNRPIILIVDTPGAYPGLEAETQSQGEAIARNLFEMTALEVPTISIITGEGGSGGALALAVSDHVAMLENAIYSILSPEGFATILWKDASRAQEASSRVKMTAQELYELGIIDGVIDEPKKGIANDFEMFSAQLKLYITRQLKILTEQSTTERIETRYQKFRSFGHVGGE
ncbi:MAG: acetyl-CoA carboxylase carboxyltransferase subunit alpha [Culicoidibacterales bacterium]